MSIFQNLASEMACMRGLVCFFGLDGKFLLKGSCFNTYLQQQSPSLRGD